MSFISRLRRSRQHRVSILSAYLVHPFPLRGTSPRWEACHWIRGSRGSPMNPVPLPPQGETRDMRKKQRVIYFTYYSSISPFGGWRHHLSPSSRGHYKAPFCCERLMKGMFRGVLFCPLHRGGKGTRFVRKRSDLRIV